MTVLQAAARERLWREAKGLIYRGCGWGDAQAEKLAEALEWAHEYGADTQANGLLLHFNALTDASIQEKLFAGREFDLVVGQRIHGSMIALAAETPTVIIAPDARVVELQSRRFQRTSFQLRLRCSWLYGIYPAHP